MNRLTVEIPEWLERKKKRETEENENKFIKELKERRAQIQTAKTVDKVDEEGSVGRKTRLTIPFVTEKEKRKNLERETGVITNKR